MTSQDQPTAGPEEQKMTGPELKARLKALRLTQKSFSIYTGAFITTVNRWVTGEFPVPQWVVRMLDQMESMDRMEAKLAALLTDPPPSWRAAIVRESQPA